MVKQASHLPIMVDPSHATGKRELIAALSKGALAVGADGVMVEIHPDPGAALCDGPQSLDFDEFDALMEELKAIAPPLGRVIVKRSVLVLAFIHLQRLCVTMQKQA